MDSSRKLALENGHIKYVAVRPCVHGHRAERYTINGQCIECKRHTRSKKKLTCPPEARSEITRQWHKERRREKYEDWVAGKISINSNRTIRLILSDNLGYKCSSCGISEWMGSQIVLEVEHKDGNSENNSFENVCLICPNCHSQTPTYKGANRGNGRHYRRQRYAEGKSF